MALNDVTISLDLAQLLGGDIDTRRTRVYVSTNVPNNTLIDTSTGEIRLGDEKVTLETDGTGSFTTWGVGADGNPTSWQTTVTVEYARVGARDRQVRIFGPFTITDADDGKTLAELEDQQAVPPNYQTTFTTSMETIRDEAEAARDAAVDISNIDTSDGVLTAVDADEDSEFRQQQDARLLASIDAGAAAVDDASAEAEGYGGKIRTLYVPRKATFLSLRGDFYAIGDGSDETDKLAEAVATAEAEALGLHIRATGDFYGISTAIHHPAGLAVWGDGADKTVIKNTYSGAADFAKGPAWFFGHYGSIGSAASEETSYLLGAASRGARTVTCQTAAEAGNFAPGDLVMTAGTTASSISGHPGLPNEINTVLAANASTGVITLKYALTGALASGSAIYLLNSGAVIGPDDITPATLLHRGALRGLRLENSLVGYQALHVAAYESTVADLVVVGSDYTIGGNPIAHCTFADVEVRYSGTEGYHAGYACHDNDFERVRWIRTGGTGKAVALQVGEGARRHKFRDSEIQDSNSSTTTQSIQLQGESMWRGGRIVGNAAGPVFLGDGCRVTDADLSAAAGGDGCNVGGVGAVVSHSRVRGTAGGKVAINLGVNAVDCMVSDNQLGDPGAPTSADYVADTGTRNRKDRNFGWYSKPHVIESFPSTVTGSTTETDLLRQSFTAGQVHLDMGWNIRATGNVSGAAGTKTIRVKLGTTSVVSLAVTGFWSITGVLQVINGGTGYSYTFSCFDGATTSILTGVVAQNYTTTTSVGITAQLSNGADSVLSYLRELQPIGGRQRA